MDELHSLRERLFQLQDDLSKMNKHTSLEAMERRHIREHTNRAWCYLKDGVWQPVGQEEDEKYYQLVKEIEHVREMIKKQMQKDCLHNPHKRILVNGKIINMDSKEIGRDGCIAWNLNPEHEPVFLQLNSRGDDDGNKEVMVFGSNLLVRVIRGCTLGHFSLGNWNGQSSFLSLWNMYSQEDGKSTGCETAAPVTLHHDDFILETKIPEKFRCHGCASERQHPILTMFSECSHAVLCKLCASKSDGVCPICKKKSVILNLIYPGAYIKPQFSSAITSGSRQRKEKSV